MTFTRFDRYVDRHARSFTERLQSLCRMPSVAAKGTGMRTIAETVEQMMQRVGIGGVQQYLYRMIDETGLVVDVLVREHQARRAEPHSDPRSVAQLALPKRPPPPRSGSWRDLRRCTRCATATLWARLSAALSTSAFDR